MVAPVRTRREFSALSSSRNRGRSGPVWVVRAELPTGPRTGRPAERAPEPGPARPHVAYAIGRSVGGAVVRNRVRRRLRALIADRARRPALRPGLYLVGATPAAAAESSTDLARHLDAAAGPPPMTAPCGLGPEPRRPAHVCSIA